MKIPDFSGFARPNIRTLKPYQAHEIPHRVKLDANESPYSAVKDPARVMPEVVLHSLNRYPDPEARALKRAIARAFGVSDGSVILGNGSDELIYYLIITFGGPVMAPVPTFSMYGIIAQALGEAFIPVPLDQDFDLDTAAMKKAIREHAPKLIFLSSPNNPTGNAFSPERVEEVIRRARGIVIVDEAYQPFSEKRSMIPLLRDFPRLGILRTVSKIGFAALRLGFLIGHEAFIAEVNKVRLPYNVNSLSQAIALHAFTRSGNVSRAVRKVVSERKRMMKALGDMGGVTPYPSDANFILFRASSADEVLRGLLAEGILVRDMQGVIPDALRVTVGTPHENDLFIEALRRAVRSSGTRADRRRRS